MSDIPHSHARTSDLESIAAAWLAKRQVGLSPAGEREFRTWLEADGRHAMIFSELEETWKTLAFPADAGMAHVALTELARRQRRRTARTTRRLMFAGLAAAAAVMMVLRTDNPVPTSASPVVTIALRPDRMRLADGTLVELNANAEVSVTYTMKQRAVQLLQGEALFTVVPDSARPFVVTAGHVSVRAVGTAFSVRRSAANVDVLVTEGSVAVEAEVSSQASGNFSPNAASQPVAAATVVVTAGARVSVPTQSESAAIATVPVSAEQVQRALAWRGKRVEFTRTPLAEAIAVFNQQNDLQLSLSTPARGEFKISGIFWSDDPEGFVRLLESGFGVVSQRQGDGIVLR